MALRKENEIAKLLLRLIRGISTGEDLQREASLSGGGDRSLGGGEDTGVTLSALITHCVPAQVSRLCVKHCLPVLVRQVVRPCAR